MTKENKLELTCKKQDCINRENYTDCFLIGTQYCKFYAKKVPISELAGYYKR